MVEARRRARKADGGHGDKPREADGLHEDKQRGADEAMKVSKEDLMGLLMKLMRYEVSREESIQRRNCPKIQKKVLMNA